MLNWLDAQVADVLAPALTGSALGTLLRVVTRPEKVATRFVAKVVVSMTVGVVLGGALIQYFHLENFMAAGAATTSAVLAEEVLAFLWARGEKLKQGKLDTSLGGDDE